MSSARSRNKFCRSLDNASRSTSSHIYFNRWSEVVPPKTALTFAALWDPEEGMVTFSGAALLEPESSSGIPPHPDIFDDDDQSQVTVTDRENGATLVAFQDAFKAFVHRTPRPSEENLRAKAGLGTSRCLHSRASSTFDGLDIYSHDVQVKPKRSLQLSCMDLLDMESLFCSPPAIGGLRSDSTVDSDRSGSESSSSAGSRPGHLKSRFSTTTTSTSNYVDVTNSALQSVHLSETSLSPISDWPRPKECASPAGSWPYLPRTPRLLRKRRPLDGRATPTTTSSPPSTPRKLVPKPWMSSSPSSPSHSVTAFSSPTASLSGEERRGRFPQSISSPMTRRPRRPPTPAPSPPSTPSKSPRLRLPFMFRLKRKSGQTSPDEDGWVCIEVTPILKQHYVANIDDD